MDPLRVIEPSDIEFLRTMPEGKQVGQSDRLLGHMIRIRSSREFREYAEHRERFPEHYRGGKIGGQMSRKRKTNR